MADTILKTNIAVRVGTDGYDLEEYDKEDGGEVQEVALAVFSFSGFTNVIFPNISLRRATDDQLRCVILWSETPKTGTTITLTLPSSLWRNYSADGATFVDLTSGFTTSNLIIDGNLVSFYINKTGVALGLGDGRVDALIAGTGGKLTIT